jgi:hypothetical protein
MMQALRPTKQPTISRLSQRSEKTPEGLWMKALPEPRNTKIRLGKALKDPQVHSILGQDKPYFCCQRLPDLMVVREMKER